MPKAKFQAATVGGSADETEAAFYEALQTADIGLLMSCWADEDDIVCVHPGGPRLVGAGAIRAAFEMLFAQGALAVRIERVQRVDALASAVHSVIERIEVLTASGPREAWVVATNVYHKTAQGWRLVAHHASPGSPHEALAGSEGPAVLH
ncbi:nuclear transport factor 2 family protein [Curvibacter sp. RS43]|jgi:ketosteroid isomerase-like protein|uniref:YybH family protein n=1 Tax=Curvibacter microcysteis TaxID=3026419 RepID=UPI002360751E|nr:nuclear transport factor 2 family protein [Curvibacter sp. RS43]MDD0812356.1 nuclear transport factor 2 family protein [Curvibacter sp. RS43]